MIPYIIGGVVLGVVALVLYMVFGAEKSTRASSNSSTVSLKPRPSSTASSGGGGTASSSRAVHRITSISEAASTHNLVIVYGTQTGTAKDFSERLQRESRKWGFKPYVMDLQDVKGDELTELPSTVVVMFVMSTYGEGEPTDNAVDFHEFVTEAANTKEPIFRNLRFTVFGLGDSTYEHYQYMSRWTTEKLSYLGAELVYPRGEGDEEQNLEEGFMTWQDSMWPALSEYCRTTPAKALGEDTRAYKLVPATLHDVADREAIEAARRVKAPLYSAKLTYHAAVVENYELHGAGSDRSCRHVTLDLGTSRIRYVAGDHVAVLPSNDPDLVAALAARVGTPLDTAFSLVSTEEEERSTPFPCPTTFGTVLTAVKDITGYVRKHTLKALACYASDPAEKAQLLKLASNTSEEGKALYHAWIKDDGRAILDVLRAFPSLNPPYDALCEFLPDLKPRYYSISSSAKAHSNRIHITCVVVQYTVGCGTVVKGVASNWLARLRPGVDTVPMYVRKSQFKLPKYKHRPVIMVGPGTGLAPFRGFIQERAVDARNEKVGQNVLFFGCRAPDVDFLYREELEAFVRDGTLTLHTAFSRVGSEKVYVTHRLLENGAEVWRLVGKESAHFYICGDGQSMSKSVQGALREIAQVHGNMTPEAAASWLTKFMSSERFALDVW